MTNDVIVGQGAYNYGELAGVGLEDIKSTDLAVPFLFLLQSNSPKLLENQSRGLRPGDMINSVTGEVFKRDEGLVFVPVHKQEKWIEWASKLQGSGVIAAHEPDSLVVKTILSKNGGSRIPPADVEGKRKPFKHNGNDVIETIYVYGLVLDEEGNKVLSSVVIPFTSTKITVCKKWFTSISTLSIRAPLFAHRVRITAVMGSNTRGTFANFSINPFKENTIKSLLRPEIEEEREILDMAASFRDTIVDGALCADYTGLQGSENQPNTVEDDEVPF